MSELKRDIKWYQKQKIKFQLRPHDEIGEYRYIREWGVYIRKGHCKPIIRFFAYRPYYDPDHPYETQSYKTLRETKFQKMLLVAAYNLAFDGEIDWYKAGYVYYHYHYQHPAKLLKWKLKNWIIRDELDLLRLYIMKAHEVISEDSVLAMLYEARSIAISHAKKTGDVQKILDVALYSAHVLGMSIVDLDPPKLKKPSRRTVTGRKGSHSQDEQPAKDHKDEMLERLKEVEKGGFTKL